MPIIDIPLTCHIYKLAHVQIWHNYVNIYASHDQKHWYTYISYYLHIPLSKYACCIVYVYLWYFQSGSPTGWPWTFWVWQVSQQKTKALSIGFNKFNRLLYSYMNIYTLYIKWLVLLIILHNDYFPNYLFWWLLLFFISFPHGWFSGSHSSALL